MTLQPYVRLQMDIQINVLSVLLGKSVPVEIILDVKQIMLLIAHHFFHQYGNFSIRFT